MHAENKNIAAICGGPGFLAYAGILENKKCTSGIAEKDTEKVFAGANYDHSETVVVDGNIITSKGEAFIKFGAEVARQVGLIETEEEYKQTINWLVEKNIYTPKTNN